MIKKRNGSFKKIKVIFKFTLFVLLINFLTGSRFYYYILDSYQSLVNINWFYKNRIRTKICYSLESKIRDLVRSEIQNWSISYINESGIEQVSINSRKPRIPASNQKLVTTAFALEKLGVNTSLRTRLTKDIFGDYHLSGEGDPDFGIYHLKKVLISIEKDQLFKSFFLRNNSVRLFLYEEPSSTWWPSGWHQSDKLETYGAPITRLGLNANSSHSSLVSPLSTTIATLKSLNSNKKLDLTIAKRSQSELRTSILDKTILQLPSARIPTLLTLANSESHNFTAEVMLRNAIKNWDIYPNIYQLNNWLISKNIPIQNLSITDGSGLSRNNRLTTNAISRLLFGIVNSNNKDSFMSTLSMLGVRGTLTNFPSTSSLKGNFYGKSGTLSGVRSLSGYLTSTSGVKIISILTEYVDDADRKISSILSILNSSNSCRKS